MIQSYTRAYTPCRLFRTGCTKQVETVVTSTQRSWFITHHGVTRAFECFRHHARHWHARHCTRFPIICAGGRPIARYVSRPAVTHRRFYSCRWLVRASVYRELLPHVMGHLFIQRWPLSHDLGRVATHRRLVLHVYGRVIHGAELIAVVVWGVEFFQVALAEGRLEVSLRRPRIPPSRAQLDSLRPLADLVVGERLQGEGG